MKPVPMQPNLPEATTALGTVVKPKQWGICPHCEQLSPMHEREWINLTVQEREKLRDEYGDNPSGLISVVQIMLKEKNSAA